MGAGPRGKGMDEGAGGLARHPFLGYDSNSDSPRCIAHLPASPRAEMMEPSDRSIRITRLSDQGADADLRHDHA